MTKKIIDKLPRVLTYVVLLLAVISFFVEGYLRMVLLSLVIFYMLLVLIGLTVGRIRYYMFVFVWSSGKTPHRAVTYSQGRNFNVRKAENELSSRYGINVEILSFQRISKNQYEELSHDPVKED